MMISSAYWLAILVGDAFDDLMGGELSGLMVRGLGLSSDSSAECFFDLLAAFPSSITGTTIRFF